MASLNGLLVTDDPRYLQTSETTLRRAGYMTASATNGCGAFLLLRSYVFELLVLDCIRDWAWIVREAKRSNPNMRIVVCSADIKLDRQVPLVDIVLREPISPSVLLELIGGRPPRKRTLLSLRKHGTGSLI
jgi:DNA-binding response OmpR family regulator